MGEHELAAIRMGRFRICPPNSPGPPETSHGRFRISTQGNTQNSEATIKPLNHHNKLYNSF